MGLRDSICLRLTKKVSRSLCLGEDRKEEENTYWQEPQEFPQGQMPVFAPAGH